MKLETGVMVFKGIKAWGIEYSDGQCTSFGWVSPDEAVIFDPRFCKSPLDAARRDCPHEEEALRDGILTHVTRRTEVIVTPQ